MATKETKDGLGYIIQAISNIVEPKVADLRYDKTYRAKVTEKVEAGIYKVKINGREYQLEYKGDLNVEDIVRVKAPLNNFSDIYIEAEPSTGGGSGGTSDYDDLFNKPILNTNNTETQPVNEKETIKGTIKLHKVSKTGNYNDLNNKPSLDFIPISEKGVANGVATLGTNSKVVSSQLPIASTSELGTIKVGANLNITEDGTLNVLTSSDTVSDTLPIGSIVKWGSYTAPKNWLLCNGQELKRNEYPDLFAAIGTTYGEGNGSTTFNLPNMSSKFSVGYNNSDSDFNSLGKTGGEKTHTLTIAEMPAHTHKTWISDTAYSERGDGYQNYYYGQGRYYNNTSSVGGSKAHNNMPPYIVMNYIIKAKQSAGVVATVVDNLDSTSSIDALSANQGKILKGYISDNDTMITTLQEDVIKVEDDITKIKSNYIPVSQKGNPNGVATLDNNALLKDTQLPIASPTRLGGIKIGENLNITADGVLNATGGGGGGSGGTSDYDDLFNKPILNTNNTETQPVNEKETIKGTIKLHKVSKTGNYNDLNNKPSLDFIPISEKGVANGVATLGTNSKVVSSQLPIASTSELGTIKVGANLNITEDGTLNVLTSSDTVSDTLPIGSIVKWGSYTAPKNWLLCNGQELKRNEYPDLFAAIGTTYGEGNGSTTFNLPNMSSKFSVGYNNSDSDFNSLGKTGGEKTHTLTIAEMPAHTHKTWISDTAYSERGDGYQNYYYGQGRYYNNTSSVGGSKAHNNMPPYIVMNYIIKAKQSAGVVATVVDNLDSTSSIDALSANQGKILNENKLNFGYSAKVNDTSIPVSKLRFTVLEVSGVGDFNIKLNKYYTLIDGQIITSFIIGQANTQNNINVTSIVPAINQTNYYNYLSELQVFSDAKTATTFVHIGVFYIPND
jgi:microcystin-dependent protein